MASNIGTASSFTTTNMKPASGEQIDALWGQNISDNSGYNYYKQIPMSAWDDAGLSNLRAWTFTKGPAHSAIKWLGRGQHGTTGVQQMIMWVWGTAGTVANNGAGAVLTATHSDTMTTQQFQRHDLDISSLADGVSYVFGVSNGGPLQYLPQGAWLTYGSGATY